MKYYEPPVFLPTRYRALPGQKDAGDHWQGGKPLHAEAVCPTCHDPYLLLWDINCFDKRFSKTSFGPWERLPLYFCWTCVGDVVYRLDEQGNFQLLNTKEDRETAKQYDPYPESFKRVPLALDSSWPKPVARIIDKLFAEKNFSRDVLTKLEQKTLDDFCGHHVTMTLFLYFQQFGGMPIHRSWSEEAIECPNPACRTHPLSKLIFGRKKRTMAFLAGILNDPWRELPMVVPKTLATKKDWNNFEATVQFHICPGCFTVHGCNRCT